MRAQQGQKTLRSFRQEPRQRYVDAQRILQHFDAPGRTLTQCAHLEAQRVTLPGLLFDRDQLSEVALASRKSFLEATNCLVLAQTMPDDNRDAIAHRSCARLGLPRLRANFIIAFKAKGATA